MTRRVLTMLCAVGALLAPAAGAAAASRGYALSATVTPNAAGTPRRPVVAGISFIATASRQGGRPPTAAGFRLTLPGIRFNGGAFPACTALQVFQTGTDSSCARGSRIGSGAVELLSGSSSDRRDMTIRCHLDVALYGAGTGQITAVLSGGPDAPRPCYRRVLIAVTASARPYGTGLTFALRLPAMLLHPVPGIDDAVWSLSARVPAKVTVLGGRRVGLLESTGGCNRSTARRRVSATFVREGGGQADASAVLPCTPTKT